MTLATCFPVILKTTSDSVAVFRSFLRHTFGGATASFSDHIIPYICKTKLDTAKVENKHNKIPTPGIH